MKGGHRILKIFTRALSLVALVWIILHGNLLLWIGTFVVFAIASVALSRLYCGWVCPMSLIMDGISSLRDRMGIKKPSRPLRTRVPWLQALSLVVFFGALVSVQTLHLKLPLLPLLVAIAVTVSLFAHESLFHSSMCPFGMIQSWLSRWALWGNRVDTDRCVGCGKCQTVCPNRCAIVADGKASIELGLCLQCGSCVDVCPVDAIGYHRRKGGQQ